MLFLSFNHVQNHSTPNNSLSITTFVALPSSCPFSTFYCNSHCFVFDFFNFLPPCHMPMPPNHTTLGHLFTYIYKQHLPHSPTHTHSYVCIFGMLLELWSRTKARTQWRESCLTAGMRWDSFPFNAAKWVNSRDQVKTTVPITYRIYWTFWLTAIKTHSITFTQLYLSKTTNSCKHITNVYLKLIDWKQQQYLVFHNLYSPNN